MVKKEYFNLTVGGYFLVLRLRLAIYINRIGSLFKLQVSVTLLLLNIKSFRNAVFAESSVITGNRTEF